MDHAGDAAYSLRRAFSLHPWNRGDKTTVQSGDREKQTFLVKTSDGGVFRVTVEDIGWEGATEAELYADDTDNSTFREDLRVLRDFKRTEVTA